MTVSLNHINYFLQPSLKGISCMIDRKSNCNRTTSPLVKRSCFQTMPSTGHFEPSSTQYLPRWKSHQEAGLKLTHANRGTPPPCQKQSPKYLNQPTSPSCSPYKNKAQFPVNLVLLQYFALQICKTQTEYTYTGARTVEKYWTTTWIFTQQRRITARSTGSNAAFKPTKTEIVGLQTKCLCFNICRRHQLVTKIGVHHETVRGQNKVGWDDVHFCVNFVSLCPVDANNTHEQNGLDIMWTFEVQRRPRCYTE